MEAEGIQLLIRYMNVWRAPDGRLVFGNEAGDEPWMYYYRLDVLECGGNIRQAKTRIRRCRDLEIPVS